MKHLLLTTLWLITKAASKINRIPSQKKQVPSQHLNTEFAKSVKIQIWATNYKLKLTS
jgi:hypothetical protein